MSEVMLSLGSNVGNRLENIRTAVKFLNDRVGKVVSASEVYETPPWGFAGQPRFLNACVTILADAPPRELLEAVKGIESDMGRVSRERWGPREIDIDILTYGDVRVDEDGLSIPHPRMSERAFVLIPLRDIAPGLRHGETGATISELLEKTDKEEIVRITSL